MRECALLFFAEMIMFAVVAGYAAAQHADKGAMNAGVLLAVVNLVGFVIAMHLWLKPGDRK